MKDNVLNKITDSVEGFFLNIFKRIGLKKFVKWYMKNQEGMRYLVFGGLSTLVNILVFIIFDNWFSTLASNTIAWIISVIFAYVTNKYCVFYSETSDSKSALKEAGSFLAARLFTLAIDEAFMYVTIDVMHLNAIVMKVISNIIVIVLNYFLSKLLVFKKKPQKKKS